MKKFTSGIILILMFNMVIFSLTPEDNKNAPKVSIIKFIPGLYQIKQNRVLKGSILLSSFIAGLSCIIINNSKGNSYYKEYLISKDVEEIIALRKKSEKRFKSRNFFIMGTSLVFLLHLFDLKFSKGKSGVKGEINNNNINLGIYYRF